MRIYEYGNIGEAVRAKLESVKRSVQDGVSTSESFSDVLNSYMTVQKEEKKFVSATGNYGGSSAAKSINGSTLLYAMQNSDEDTTASTVLSMLGFDGYTSNTTTQLKTAAEGLTDSAAMLISLNETGTENVSAISDFVTDYNNLMTRLNGESNSSSYLYKTAFSAALTAASEQLTAAGILQDNGYLSYEGKSGVIIPDDFLTSVVTAANTVSAYATSITGDEEQAENGISDYYTALMNSML